MSLVWTTGTTYEFERKRQIFSDTPAIDNSGRIGNPKWVVQSTVGIDWSRFQLLWQMRYIGQTQFAEDRLDPEEPFRVNPEFNTSIPTADDATADRRLYNDVSVSTDFDRFTVTLGVRNITDTKPPLIDDSSGPNRNNAVSSSGFDFFGRTWFLRTSIHF